MARETFVIETAEVKQTTSEPAKTYARVKMQGGRWLSVWGNGDREFVLGNVGQMVSAELEQKGDFVNASGFTLATGTEAGGSASYVTSTSSGLSKAEWDLKEDRDHLRRLYVTHLMQLGQFRNAEPETSPVQSYKELVETARRYAVSDLEWIRTYATEEVPFG